MAKQPTNASNEPNPETVHLLVLLGPDPLVEELVDSLSYYNLAIMGVSRPPGEALPGEVNVLAEYIASCIADEGPSVERVSILNLSPEPSDQTIHHTQLSEALAKQGVTQPIVGVTVKTESGCRVYLEESCCLTPDTTPNDTPNDTPTPSTPIDARTAPLSASQGSGLDDLTSRLKSLSGLLCDAEEAREVLEDELTNAREQVNVLRSAVVAANTRAQRLLSIVGNLA